MKKKDIILVALLVFLLLCVLGVGYIVVSDKLRFKARPGEASSNLKYLADAVEDWYERQHTTPGGVILPAHFPRLDTTDKALKTNVSATLPKEKPCHNGKAQYPKNSAQWNVEPWLSLRFKIQKPHHYQYTYIAQGSGATSTAVLHAQADLDCDGKLSSYKITLKIDKETGEVIRSLMVVVDPLE